VAQKQELGVCVENMIIMSVALALALVLGRAGAYDFFHQSPEQHKLTPGWQEPGLWRPRWIMDRVFYNDDDEEEYRDRIHFKVCVCSCGCETPTHPRTHTRTHMHILSHIHIHTYTHMPLQVF